jgi:galactokinase
MSIHELKSPSANEQQIADRLANCGMSGSEATSKGRLFAQAEARLRELSDGSATETYRVFVPGRVEVLGKHTDYAGGRSLLVAVERGFSITAMPRRDRIMRIVDAASGERVQFELGSELTPTVGHWSNYPMTVGRRVARNFPGPLYGADIAMGSDLPPAAGMSSSSALMIGIFTILARVNGLAQRAEYKATLVAPEALAGYLATIENGQSFGPLAGDRGVGTFGGSEDHTAICCCRPGELRVYSFCPARLERTIELPHGYVLAIAASGVLAEKTGDAMAKYNRASRLVSALLDLWRSDTGRSDGCLAAAAHSAPEAPDRLRGIIARRPHPDFDPPALLRRLEQFLGENDYVIPAASEALALGAMEMFGGLVDRSQRLAEDLLQNQIPQTICLARTARSSGAVAASSFGAGFGGSVWALIEARRAEEFLALWSRRYRQEFPAEAQRSCFFVSGAGPGLIEL